MKKEIITESKVIIENGEAKTILSEETQRRGWMSVDEFVKIGDEWINKMIELHESQ